MNILVTICARSGSKGIPNKNIKPIKGVPLLAYSIILANKIKAKYGADIGFSTDSKEYKAIAEDYGLYTEYLRPDSLASDNAGKIDVIAELKNFEELKRNKKYDFIIELEVTSPLRNLEDVDRALQALKLNKEADIIVGVSPVTKNPYYNMWEQKKDGFWTLSKELPKEILTRQSAPKVYSSNGMVYIMRDRFFEKNYKSIVTENTMVYVSKHICFDLDEKIDFEFMEYMIEQNKLDFDLELEF